MKKKALTLLLAVCMLFMATPAFAIDVVVSNQKLTLDQEPIIDYGRTLVPMRAIFEALGATVHWDAETQTITANKGDDNITLIINKTDVIHNDKIINLDAPAKLVNGRTMVPVRFVAESLGANVEWLDTNRTVYINSAVPKSPAVDPAMQWISDKYYVPSDSSDAIVGSWRHTHTKDMMGIPAGTTTYLFVKKVANNQYEVVRFLHEPFKASIMSYDNAITGFAYTADYNTASKQLNTTFSTPFYYEGPPRGFIGLVRHQLRLANNNLFLEYDIYTMGNEPDTFQEVYATLQKY